MEVRTHPAVEDFIRQLGNGTKKALEMYGKTWSSFPGEAPLEVYHLNGPINGANGFRLDNPADVLKDDVGQLNLSFLRIAGVSSGSGVRFRVRGVYSLPLLERISDEIGSAVKQLYRDYIKTVNLAVVVSTQEY